MVVFDPDVHRQAFNPAKDDSILIVYSNAMLVTAPAPKPFESITRREAKIFEPCGVEGEVQFSQCVSKQIAR